MSQQPKPSSSRSRSLPSMLSAVRIRRVKSNYWNVNIPYESSIARDSSLNTIPRRESTNKWIGGIGIRWLDYPDEDQIYCPLHDHEPISPEFVVGNGDQMLSNIIYYKLICKVNGVRAHFRDAAPPKTYQELISDPEMAEAIYYRALLLPQRFLSQLNDLGIKMPNEPPPPPASSRKALIAPPAASPSPSSSNTTRASSVVGSSNSAKARRLALSGAAKVAKGRRNAGASLAGGSSPLASTASSASSPEVNPSNASRCSSIASPLFTVASPNASLTYSTSEFSSPLLPRSYKRRNRTYAGSNDHTAPPNQNASSVSPGFAQFEPMGASSPFRAPYTQRKRTFEDIEFSDDDDGIIVPEDFGYKDPARKRVDRKQSPATRAGELITDNDVEGPIFSIPSRSSSPYLINSSPISIPDSPPHKVFAEQIDLTADPENDGVQSGIFERWLLNTAKVEVHLYELGAEEPIKIDVETSTKDCSFRVRDHIFSFNSSGLITGRMLLIRRNDKWEEVGLDEAINGGGDIVVMKIATAHT